MNCIPSTEWTTVPLGEIAEINPRHPKGIADSVPVTFVPMACLNENKSEFQVTAERPLGDVRKGFTHFVEGDVLFAKITPCMENGKGGVARNLKNGLGCGTTEIHVIRPSNRILADFIYLYLAQPSIRNSAKENFTGSAGQARVPTSFINALPIPVPPLSEQRRIVDKLEKVLEKVNACQQRLEKFPALLKRFRQSILSAACSGRLTADWRNLNDRKIESDWKTLSMNSLGKLFCGQSPSRQFVNDSGSGVPYVTGPDQWNGKSLEMRKWTTKPNRVVPNGCVFITVKGAGVGTVFPGVKCAIGRDIYAFKSSTSIAPKFVLFTMQNAIETIRGMAQGDIPGLTRGQIMDRMITVPSIEEQELIVNRVEEYFVLIALIEARYTKAKTHVEKLTQSILAKAFRGELVLQKPADEPAGISGDLRANMPEKVFHSVYE